MIQYNFKKRTITPVGLYESNYRKLIKLFPELPKLYSKQEKNKTHSNKELDKKIVYYCHSLQLEIIEIFKYTGIVKLFRQLPINRSTIAINSSMTNTDINFKQTVSFNLRLCHDASLAEVVNFQGSEDIDKYFMYPNKNMFLFDEKKQLNYHVKSILDMAIAEREAEIIDKVY